MSPVHLRDLGTPRSHPEDQGLERMVNGKELREIMPMIPFTFQFNIDLKPEDLRDMDTSALQTPQRSSPIEHVKQEVQPGFALGRTLCKLTEICLKKIYFKDPIEITKGWNSNRKFKLLEDKEAKFRENKATIQSIEEQWSQKGNILTPSGSQVVGQASSPVASNHSEYRKSGAKSHHYSQFQEFFSRRQGSKGKNKTTFSQRKKESHPTIQKLLD
ncbi:hypothetical protein O181_090320 [Austropuccinia psidii MF-1]|uniref:Uncharacterized protein n=1 Tax=Austropuccinia psidii MF-1 TaxID=1389203 RepID=A0A9Q3IUV0_9BASI|nr:hypothetical protein [Austropuccinia psidii MF-1]